MCAPPYRCVARKPLFYLPPAYATYAETTVAKFMKTFVPPSKARAEAEAILAAEVAKARGDEVGRADKDEEPSSGDKPAADAAGSDDESEANNDDSDDDELGIADAQKGDSDSNVKMSAAFSSFQFNEGPVSHALVGTRRDGRVLVWSTETWTLRFEIGDSMHPSLRAWICKLSVCLRVKGRF